MIKPALALLACLGTLTVLPAQAQGLRMPGAMGPRLSLPLSTPGGTPAVAQRQADYIVAIVNTEPVTNNEVRVRALRLQQQLAQQNLPMPPASEILSEALNRLISEKSQLQFAKESGIKVDDSQIDLAELTVAAQNQIDVAELRRRVASDGIGPQQLRDDLRSQLILQRVRERDVEPRVRITDLQADQYLLEQKQNQDPSQQLFEIAQILVPVAEGATPAQVADAQARAQSLYERAAKGEDFAALARTAASTPDAASGGRMGARPLDRYPELFAATVRALAVGAVAAPVRSGAGFHVLKLVQKTQSDGLDAAVTQNHVRHILLRTGPQLSQAQAVARLAGYKQRIQASQADFAALARDNSQDGSASEGGDLGWARPGQFVPEFEEAIDKLQPGAISDPVVSRFGVHLIQLLERRSLAPTPREQREAARAVLREKKMEEAYANWAQDIRGRAYVEMREAPQ